MIDTGDWDDDGEAWSHLASFGFTHNKGFISPPSPDFDFAAHPHTIKQAINYLFWEWDWAYVGECW
jgi:hypothetical protein